MHGALVDTASEYVQLRHFYYVMKIEISPVMVPVSGSMVAVTHRGLQP